MKLILMAIGSALLLLGWTILGIALSQWVVNAFPDVGENGDGAQFFIFMVMTIVGVALAIACLLAIGEEFDE